MSEIEQTIEELKNIHHGNAKSVRTVARAYAANSGRNNYAAPRRRREGKIERLSLGRRAQGETFAARSD